MEEHQRRLRGDTIEFCLQTSTPVTGGALITPYSPAAARVGPMLRPVPRHVDLATLVRAWRRVADAINRVGFDVVLAHPCQYLQAPLALRWVDAPTVYFCHEPRRVDYEPTAAASVNPRTRLLYGGLHRAERTLDRIATASAERLLTNSRFTARRIEQAYGRTAEVVPLGVADLFRDPPPASRRTHLLSVGTLIESKGHDLAIRAAALTARRRALVVVAPRADPEEAQRLQRLAQRSGIELDIRIGISDTELRELYRGAASTLYLAREEPFGLASLEAQACGSPVVVADDGGLPETILAARSGWAVSREDPRAVARVIDALEDPDVWSAASARAREHGLKQTWERSTALVQDALEHPYRS